MASTILVNSLKAQSGTEVEVPTGFTLNIADTGALTVNDVAITVGSSNIARKTADYTVLEADVSGKSELVITCNASASNRTITLPAVATSGLSTCIITIVADADATSTYELKVQDIGTTEVWTGFQKGDFVRLVVSNSVWVVLDHKETMFSSRALTSSQGIAASATTKVTGWTNRTDIGKVWDNTNNKLVAPFAGIWDLNWRTTTVANGANVNVFYVGGSQRYTPATSSDTVGYNYPRNMSTLRVKVAASTDIEFYAHNVVNSSTQNVLGNGNDQSGFDGTFTRTY
jgi:hypothetical protein